VTLLLLVILAVAWAAVLLPPWLRNRSETRPSDSIVLFRRQLSVLERARPSHGGGHARLTGVPDPFTAKVHRGPATAPGVMSRRAARKRRRDVLIGLLVTMVVTLGLGLAFRPFLGLHLLVDVLLVVYVVLLVRARQAAEEREAKVRYLPAQPAHGPTHGPEPALALASRPSGS
jgi:hypothetical protein